jgi:amidase
MAIHRPTIDDLKQIASNLHMQLTDLEAEEYLSIMQANFDAYDLIDEQVDEIPEVHYPRTEPYRPDITENYQNGSQRCTNWKTLRKNRCSQR